MSPSFRLSNRLMRKLWNKIDNVYYWSSHSIIYSLAIVNNKVWVCFARSILHFFIDQRNSCEGHNPMIRMQEYLLILHKRLNVLNVWFWRRITDNFHQLFFQYIFFSIHHRFFGLSFAVAANSLVCCRFYPSITRIHITLPRVGIGSKIILAQTPLTVAIKEPVCLNVSSPCFRAAKEVGVGDGDLLPLHNSEMRDSHIHIYPFPPFHWTLMSTYNIQEQVLSERILFL